MLPSIFEAHSSRFGAVEDPAAFDVPLFHQADAELLEGAAVALGRGHEVPRLELVVGAVDQERLHGGHDGRHPGGGRAAGGLAVEAVGFQQRQGPLEIIRRGVGDPRVAPGGDQVGQRGGHLVRIAVGLRGGHEDRLDDCALIVLDGVLHGVQAVDGDGVELPAFDLLADIAVAFGQIFVVLIDVTLHSRGDVDFGTLGHDDSPG